MFDSAAYSRDVIDTLTPSPFNWRIYTPEPPPLSDKEARDLATAQRNRESARVRSAVRRAATRVNPQSDVCQPFMPKSVTTSR